MRRVAAKFLPKLLNCDLKQHRMNIANEMLYSVRDDPYLLQREEGLTFEGALDIALSAESADNDLHNIKRSENAHQSPQHLHAISNACKHCEFVVGMPAFHGYPWAQYYWTRLPLISADHYPAPLIYPGSPGLTRR
ncbi:hypothetical protein LAZ67_8002649 [Cordylochernes scorpioides]|uniref:Uncharacterized protein n=1 Tax=Cordylochernes scorpioides TaxID=51811 RepID=A0ABY6KR44_9ARAC|nr:hypothetical protein LAZ67_8002649 [Cordylochernes scorpioides]